VKDYIRKMCLVQVSMMEAKNIAEDVKFFILIKIRSVLVVVWPYEDLQLTKEEKKG